MPDPFVASDVGPRLDFEGNRVDLPLTEREATATRWNANVAARAIKDADDAARDARLTEIRALMETRTASLPDMQEYLLLKDV